MATPDYWADSPFERDSTLFARYFPTLDSLIHPDDPVRLVDEVLSQVDWSLWESEFPRRKGQPPIRPQHVAAAILYGMYRGIRSSRKLEQACNYRFDFMWLVEGRHIDHSTFNKFRTKFREPLKDLFKQIGRIAMTLGLIRLGEVAFDATRIKANNSRFGTRVAKTLEEKLKALDELFDYLMSRLNEADADGMGQGATQLPDDPSVPVPEAQWAKLPRNNQGQLDKSCFVYLEAENQYYCPQGQAMPFAKTKPERRGEEVIQKRIYRCAACAGCPLASACLSPKSKHGRTITRDVYEEVRERTAARMSSEAARKLYNQRPRIAETTFGIVKQVMGMRQFLLRGLEKVKTEWLWAVTAFNVMKLSREIGKLRAEFSNLAAGE